MKYKEFKNIRKFDRDFPTCLENENSTFKVLISTVGKLPRKSMHFPGVPAGIIAKLYCYLLRVFASGIC